MWRNLCVLVLGGWIAVGSISEGNAEDWPMWRFDAGRTAASSEVLPDRLMLQWTLALTARRQTWDDALNRDLMTYDRIFEPVVAEGRLFLAFNDRDKVVAYDVSTGTKLWTCFASGPVRLPPVVWQGHVYFASDDGNLYCVTAATGEEKWRFRGGPDARQVLGNQRLVSAWPMRGGPVIRDGQIYMAASIWPFMGVFIYALDAKTGDVLWVNDDTGSEYVKNVKKTPSFGSIAPQGALVATENLLLVPGGRTVPAVFDRGSGRMEYYGLATAGKGVGGSFVAANETNWFVHTRLKGTLAHDLTTGEKSAFSPNQPVLAPHFIYSAELDGITPVIRAYDAQTHAKIWETAADGRGDLILAGQTLYAAGHGLDSDFDSASPRSTLTAIRLPTGSQPAKILWTQSTEGTVERLAAANQRLFAVTREGHVLAFGAGETTRPTVHREIEMALAVSETAAGRSAELLQAGDAAGYAIWLGAADAATIEAIALSSSFVELAVFDEDTARVRQLRNRLDGAGLYGRVTAHSTIWDEFAPPPYVANMIFVAPEVTARGIDQPGWLTRLYGSVRPYGGVMHVLAPAAEAGSVHRKILAARLERADVKRSSHGVIVRRVGPLPGAGTWTHRYGDIANSIKSSDERVKLPLGILWFGGASHDDVLPRHGHGPPEQVVGGRLFIEGINQLTARDVYTGRMLWQRQFKDFGTSDVFLDATYADTPLDTAYNQVHIPGSNARGTNYVVTPDRLYAVEGDLCHVLDPATGKSLREIRMPALAEGRPNDWGYLGVYEDVLIGGTGFANYRARYAIPEAVPDATISRNRLGFGLASLDRAGSLALVGFNRYTGEPLWKIEALHSFWHNGIVAGHGLVYALDKNPQPVEEFLRR
ncbi:MAG: PQQ-binding-like beta-propeller repeat protein, partial [Pirellulaceae bacterium]